MSSTRVPPAGVDTARAHGAAGPSDTARPSGAARPVERGLGGKIRSALLWAAVVVAAVAVLAVTTWPRGNQTPLDPDNAGRLGTKALVEVLRAKGIRVDVVRTQAELRAITQSVGASASASASADASDASTASTASTASAASAASTDADRRGATLVVSDSSEVYSDAMTTIASVRDSYARLVLAGLPAAAVDEATGLPVQEGDYAGFDDRSSGSGSGGSGSASTFATCADPRFDQVTTITTGPGSYIFRANEFGEQSELGWQSCFPVSGGYGLLSTQGTEDSVAVDVLGATRPLTNQSITSDTNAAFALRLLSDNPRVVWFVPSDDGGAGAGAPVERDADPLAVLPVWFTPLVYLLGIAVLATMLWRGRRLGRLVVEPLPVVVRAIETTRSRGRLYAKSRERSHALAALQEGTRERLLSRLGLAPRTDREALVAAVVHATGRSPAEVATRLYDSTVDKDDQLLARAQGLTSLEEEVRHR